MDIEEAWNNLNLYNQSLETEKPPASMLCKSCKSDNVSYTKTETVCCECGLVIEEFLAIGTSQFDSVPEVANTRRKPHGSSRIEKMQEWYMWTNDEKNTYKLTCYTKQLCTKLQIPEMLSKRICNTVVVVMAAIKKHEGTKRARVKDGIIITCIQYVTSDMNSSSLTAAELAKKIDLDIKYVTKAEKMILELLNGNKINLDKQKILDTQKPYHYVEAVIQKECLQIPENILLEVEKLINICEENDLLLDHTPLSIGVCCFYYILKLHDIALDLKLFSELYDLSVVTVIKTYNKLQLHEKTLFRLLNG
jgi:transcription initiation factor TFIIIB Brf1 subunit/transcription initiation factor TFIIB